MKMTLMLLALLSLPMAAHATCDGPDWQIEGKLSLVTSTHPNGTLIEALIVETVEPLQVTTAVDGLCAEARRFQIVPQDETTGAALLQAVGKRVIVRSDTVFEAETAWHIGDAVALDAALQRVANY